MASWRGFADGARRQAHRCHRGVEAFLKQRARPSRKWVETADERFTSSPAKQAVLQSGIGRKARREGQLDRISATIMLQDWLTRKG